MNNKDSQAAALAEASCQTDADRLRRFLDAEAWRQVPALLRRHPISKAEREAILGYGPDGV